MVSYVCVSKLGHHWIGSGNGLSPKRRQAIIEAIVVLSHRIIINLSIWKKNE